MKEIIWKGIPRNIHFFFFDFLSHYFIKRLHVAWFLWYWANSHKLSISVFRMQHTVTRDSQSGPEFRPRHRWPRVHEWSEMKLLIAIVSLPSALIHGNRYSRGVVVESIRSGFLCLRIEFSNRYINFDKYQRICLVLNLKHIFLKHPRVHDSQ